MPEPSRSAGPTRTSDSLADVVEMLLDKGIVINADIAVSVGETELLGIHIRAAIASFETAAKYGLQFPDGTDARRVQEAAGVEPLDEGEEVGDGAPISVNSPSRGGVSDRPRADEDDEDSTVEEAVEEAENAVEEATGDDGESGDDTNATEAGDGTADGTNDGADEGDAPAAERTEGDG